MKTEYRYIKELMQKVTPADSYKGENFAQWQQSARKTLYNLLGMANFEQAQPDTVIEYENKIDGATEIRFTFQSEAGYRVPCHLLLPDGIEKPPVIICLQGHSKGMHISLGRTRYENEDISGELAGDRDFCLRAVKEGFAAIALEQRNFGECGGTKDGPACFEPALIALLMGRTTIGERVWDVQRLIDLIENEFADKVDTDCICCMGNSGGGTATAYTAALEDRIKLAMPSCALCTYKDSIGAMNHCACNYIPHIAEHFEMGDIIAMAYPKYYVQVSGIEDSIFPHFAAKQVFEQGKKAYADNGDGDKCVLVNGNGGHRFYADDAWPAVHKLLDK